MPNQYPRTEEFKKKISKSLKGIPHEIVYLDQGCELHDKCLLCLEEPCCIDEDNRFDEIHRKRYREMATILKSDGQINDYPAYEKAMQAVKELYCAISNLKVKPMIWK
jgi:hypothetical protein